MTKRFLSWSYRRLALLFLVVSMLSLGSALTAWGHHNAQHEPPLLRDVGLAQNLQARLPLDLAFRDESGAEVRLADYVHDKPVILTLAYYDCANLCPLVLNGLVRAMRGFSLTLGKDFVVITVSIDPRDTPADAAAMKRQYVQRYGGPNASAGWHFLTGTPEAIQHLTRVVGFRYTYDPVEDQYAHASGIMVLTPAGILARYFYGIDYAPKDLRLGLVEAANNTIGTPIDQLLLLCYRYDPLTGKYGLAIMSTIRVAGLVTVLCLGAFMGVMIRRDRRLRPGTAAPGAPAEH